MLQAARDLEGDVDGLRGLERAAADLGRQRLTLVIPHDDKGPAIGSLLDGMDGGDVRVVESGGSARFAQETIAIVFGNIVIRQELKGDGAIQLEIKRSIDNTHTPGAELSLNVVTGNAADRRWPASS